MKFKPKFAAKHVGHLVQTNSPTILSAVAVVGVAATGYLTFRATWAGHRLVTDENLTRQSTGSSLPIPLTKQEQALKIWKLYIPAVAAGVGTVGCIVLSNRIHARRAAAMLAAYGVLSGDFDEYKAKAREILGEKKSKDIQDQIAQDKVTKVPAPLGIPLEDGQTWFCDLNTMRYFKSDRQSVEKARNDFNYMLPKESYMSLNDMYSLIGIDSTELGKTVGWKADQRVEVNFSAVLMPDGSAATAFTFNPAPSPDFDDLH